MNIKSWLQVAKTQVDALDAELIALKVFAPKGSDRSWLVTHDVDKVQPAQQRMAVRMLERRRSGTPLAYILGEKEFYGRKFMVRPDVLIPRPETEALINLVKTLSLPKQPKFLEIGTGSGCIAITLALEYPQSRVVASDISVKALDIAERNDVLHEGRIELVESNLLRDFEFTAYPEHFDVLVANLPYVNKEWQWIDAETLDFEPNRALYAKGNNGLSVYQRLLKEINHYGGPDSLWVDFVVFEADPCQHEQLIKMAKKAGLYHIKTEGYGLLFEDMWRYWYDYRVGDYVHKPQEVINLELKTHDLHFIPEEYDPAELEK